MFCAIVQIDLQEICTLRIKEIFEGILAMSISFLNSVLNCTGTSSIILSHKVIQISMNKHAVNVEHLNESKRPFSTKLFIPKRSIDTWTYKAKYQNVQSLCCCLQCYLVYKLQFNSFNCQKSLFYKSLA